MKTGTIIMTPQQSMAASLQRLKATVEGKTNVKAPTKK